MEFNLRDYLQLSANRQLLLPSYFTPYFEIDRRKFERIKDRQRSIGLSIPNVFQRLHQRTGDEYFFKIYPAQNRVLTYSANSFPAYRFIIPDVLADDWLGIVDVHQKFSRDHAFHQPLTAYIVHKLLFGGISGDSFTIDNIPLLDLCIKKILHSEQTNYIRNYLANLGAEDDYLEMIFTDNHRSRILWKNLFYETAILAALFHDIGYPWQYINKLTHSISSIDFNPSSLQSNSNSILNHFGTRLLLYPFNGYNTLPSNAPISWSEEMKSSITDAFSLTHGLPGAIGFLHLNDITRQFPSSIISPIKSLCIEWAAMGILMHDMAKIFSGNQNGTIPRREYLRLYFERDPLSCIITLSDILENFERPNIELDPRSNESRFKYKSNCLSTELINSNDKLIINFKYRNISDVRNVIGFIYDDHKLYFDPNDGYIDLASIGINTVEMNCTV